MLKNQPSGTFIVRFSETKANTFALDVQCDNEQMENWLIPRYQNMDNCEEVFLEKPFDSLQDLIKNSPPEFKLKKPYPKILNQDVKKRLRYIQWKPENHYLSSKKSRTEIETVMKLGLKNCQFGRLPKDIILYICEFIAIIEIFNINPHKLVIDERCKYFLVLF